MAKDKEKTVTVFNRCDSARNYPLADNTGLYMKPRRRGDKGVAIKPQQVSEALKNAERNGLISLIWTDEEVSDNGTGDA